MAVTATPVYHQAINTGVVQIANADASNSKTIFTAGTNGSRVTSLVAASTDTSSRDVNFFLTRSGTDYLLATVSIVLSSGNANNVPNVDIFRSGMLLGLSVDAAGNKYLDLKSGDTLTCKATTTVTSAKLISLIATGVDL